jgi:1,4-alpha-glucan branching enzyme
LQNKKREIQEAEQGTLAEFAQGYKKYGFNRKENGIIYREWAPSAQAISLIGEFSTCYNWRSANYQGSMNG